MGRGQGGSDDSNYSVVTGVMVIIACCQNMAAVVVSRTWTGKHSKCVSNSYYCCQNMAAIVVSRT